MDLATTWTYSLAKGVQKVWSDKDTETFIDFSDVAILKVKFYGRFRINNIEALWSNRCQDD